MKVKYTGKLTKLVWKKSAKYGIISLLRMEWLPERGARVDKFLELAKKYTDFTELTAPILYEFVEKVLVHEADKSSGKREQQVDIPKLYRSFHASDRR